MKRRSALHPHGPSAGFVEFVGPDFAPGYALFCLAGRCRHKNENISVRWSIVLHAQLLLYLAHEMLFSA
jgi:hypothetical protein